MRFSQPKREEISLGISIAPLIDIIFLLLIFFMLTSHFEIISGIDIRLPDINGFEVTKNFTITKLKRAGAKEIHVRPACPPLMFPCIYNLSTRTTKELAARKAIRAIEGKDIENVSDYLNHKSVKFKQMVDWIAKDLDVTTLRYQRLDDMIKAIGLPKYKLCLYCWTGNNFQEN